MVARGDGTRGELASDCHFGDEPSSSLDPESLMRNELRLRRATSILAKSVRSRSPACGGNNAQRPGALSAHATRQSRLAQGSGMQRPLRSVGGRRTKKGRRQGQEAAGWARGAAHAARVRGRTCQGPNNGVED